MLKKKGEGLKKKGETLNKNGDGLENQRHEIKKKGLRGWKKKGGWKKKVAGLKNKYPYTFEYLNHGNIDGPSLPSTAHNSWSS